MIPKARPAMPDGPFSLPVMVLTMARSLDTRYPGMYIGYMLKSTETRLVILTCIALTLSTLLVYGQVRNFEFVNYDDNDYVYANQDVLNGLSWDGVIRAFTTPVSNHWHPLTCISLMLNRQLFGMDPGWFHLVNVFLHLANTLLLFAVLSRMTGALWPSAFVAAAFALHPMHVESVAWIAERKDVLSTFFLLLTLASYTGYVRQPTAIRYIVTLILFALGLMAKAMLVTVPFVLLLLDYWPLRRFDLQAAEGLSPQNRDSASNQAGRRFLRGAIIEKIPFFVLSAVSSAIAYMTQKVCGGVVDTRTVPLMDRVANTLLSYVVYVGKMFWPENMAPFYPIDAGAIGLWECVLYALLLAGVSIFVLRYLRTQKYLAVGWFWFLGMLVPVIGIVLVGYCAYADRYTYASYIGLFVMIAWGLTELLQKWPQRRLILGISAVMALAAMGTYAHRQVGYWKDRITLFSHTIEVTRNNHVAYNNRGAAYYDLGRWQDVIADCGEAVRIKPDYADARKNMGFAYCRLGRWQEAIEHFSQAVRIRPGNAEAYNNLAFAYSNLGQWPEAIDAYKYAVSLNPDYAEAYNNLGIAYGEVGRWQDAVDAHKQAVRALPGYAEAHNSLGNGYGKLGRWPEAIAAYEQATKARPDYAVAYNNLGSAYGRLGRTEEAIGAYLQAVRLKPDIAETRYNLANEFVTQGKCNDAAEQYRAALGFRADWLECMNNLALLIATHPEMSGRDPNEAVRLASRVCELSNHSDPAFLATLAASYSAAGRLDDAVATATKAASLADGAGQNEVAEVIRGQLVLYKQGKAGTMPALQDRQGGR